MLLYKKALGHHLKVSWSIDKYNLLCGEFYFKINNNKINTLWINGIFQQMAVLQGH
jgi:hypothetical protein